MVVLMLVEVVAEFKTMRQYLAMRKLGSVPNGASLRIFLVSNHLKRLNKTTLFDGLVITALRQAQGERMLS